MKLVVHNHLTELLEASEAEQSWLAYYAGYWDVGFYKVRGRTKRGKPRRVSLLRKGWFPSGLLLLIAKGAKQEGFSIEYVDRRIVPDPPNPAANLAFLRDYQRAAVDAVLAKRRGVVDIATAGGKSVLAVGLVVAWPIRWLFLVGQKSLLDQIAKEYERWTGKTANIIGDGRFEIDDPAGFTIAMKQTLVARREDPEVWRFVEEAEGVILDECFPAGTLVDGRAIETIQVGDPITCYNEQTGGVERGFVVRRMVRLPAQSPLVQVTTVDGRKVVCTDNHPFLTPVGWIPARSLAGLSVLCTVAHDPVQHLSAPVRADERCQSEAEDRRAEEGLLQSGMSGQSQQRVREEIRAQEQSDLVGAHEEAQSDAHAGCETENDAVPQHERHSLVTSGTRGERTRINVARKAVDDGARAGLGATSGSDSKVSSAGLSMPLQDRRREQGLDGSDRSRRQLAPRLSSREARLEEDSSTHWVRVESVQVLEQASRAGFEGLPERDLVFNLEVTPHHNYIANGFVVHNCHGAGAATDQDILLSMKRAYARIGLSGTPWGRSDQKNLLTLGALGPTLYKMTAPELTEQGRVVPLDITMVELTQYSDRATYQGVYGELVVRSTARNRLVVELVQKAAKPCLCFVKEVLHGKELTRRLTRAGMTTEFVWGEKATEQRAAAVERLIRGDADVIVSSPVFVQGIDIPALRSVVVAASGKSTIQTLQRIGRGMRTDDGKTKCEVVDILDLGQTWLEKHAKLRKKTYEEAGHPVVVIKSSSTPDPTATNDSTAGAFSPPTASTDTP